MGSKYTVAEVTDGISNLEPKDLEFVAEHFAEIFGLVSPFVAPAPVAAVEVAKPQAEKVIERETEEELRDLMLVEVGEKKIAVTKSVVNITNLELKQAYDLVNSVADGKGSQVLKKGLTLDEAKNLKDRFDAEGTGATVEIQEASAPAKGGGNKKIVATGLGGLSLYDMVYAVQKVSGKNRSDSINLYSAIDPRTPQTIAEGLSEEEAKEGVQILFVAGVIAHIE